MMKVLDVPVYSGKLNNSLLHTYLKQMQPKRRYDICPEMETEYMKLKDKLNRKPMVIHEWPRGFRYDHINCEIWFNTETVLSNRLSRICKNCEFNKVNEKSMKITAKKTSKKNGKKTSKKSKFKFFDT